LTALSTPSVTVVIPVWNQSQLLRALLKSVAAQTAQPERIVIVDNASTEDIASIATEADAQYIRMPRNQGFAAAVNRGIDSAQTQWIALLNSDVALQPDWLEQLLQRAAATDAWYACGKLLMTFDPTRIDGTWDLIACSGCAYRNGQGRKDAPQFSQEREIVLCPATAAIYRRELFDRVGRFSEVYESYLEDVDFSLRCAAAGYRGLYVPTAQATHVGQGSSSRWSRRVVELNARNQVLLIKRLYPLQLQKQFRWKTIAGQFLWGLVACRHFRLGSWVRGRRAAAKLDVAAQPLDEASLTRLLVASEREIRRQVKPDLYWRLYFLITGAESK
jgi:GT2 family glycosyltransferase